MRKILFLSLIATLFVSSVLASDPPDNGDPAKKEECKKCTPTVTLYEIPSVEQMMQPEQVIANQKAPMMFQYQLYEDCFYSESARDMARAIALAGTAPFQILTDNTWEYQACDPCWVQYCYQVVVSLY